MKGNSHTILSLDRPPLTTIERQSLISLARLYDPDFELTEGYRTDFPLPPSNLTGEELEEYERKRLLYHVIVLDGQSF